MEKHPCRASVSPSVQEEEERKAPLGPSSSAVLKGLSVGSVKVFWDPWEGLCVLKSLGSSHGGFLHQNPKSFCHGYTRTSSLESWPVISLGGLSGPYLASWKGHFIHRRSPGIPDTQPLTWPCLGRATEEGRRCKGYSGEFPGGPVVKTLCSHCRGHWFDPWSGN